MSNIFFSRKDNMVSGEAIYKISVCIYRSGMLKQINHDIDSADQSEVWAFWAMKISFIIALVYVINCLSSLADYTLNHFTCKQSLVLFAKIQAHQLSINIINPTKRIFTDFAHVC